MIAWKIFRKIRNFKLHKQYELQRYWGCMGFTNLFIEAQELAKKQLELGWKSRAFFRDVRGVLYCNFFLMIRIIKSRRIFFYWIKSFWLVFSWSESLQGRDYRYILSIITVKSKSILFILHCLLYLFILWNYR